MNTFFALTKRDIKLFFRDKGMFFTSMITPVILLVLYASFLGNIYRDSFVSQMPEGLSVSGKIVDGLVAGQLISSILAVSCVTVAFCSNFLMVQDRANGTIKDLRIAPIRASMLSMSYYVATLLSTLVICLAAAGIGLAYIAALGWYLSAADVLCLLLDVLLLVLFGTALSSIISFFLTTQGQISAVGTIVSAGYGFLCGAYMPISSFSVGLQKVISLLPGTYGTALLRNHAMQGAFSAMQREGVPETVIEELKKAMDCRLMFFDRQVGIPGMYLILGISVAVLVLIYVLLNIWKKQK